MKDPRNVKAYDKVARGYIEIDKTSSKEEPLVRDAKLVEIKRCLLNAFTINEFTIPSRKEDNSMLFILGHKHPLPRWQFMEKMEKAYSEGADLYSKERAYSQKRFAAQLEKQETEEGKIKAIIPGVEFDVAYDYAQRCGIPKGERREEFIKKLMEKSVIIEQQPNEIKR